jgi:hypothetical protein
LGLISVQALFSFVKCWVFSRYAMPASPGCPLNPPLADKFRHEIVNLHILSLVAHDFWQFVHQRVGAVVVLGASRDWGQPNSAYSAPAWALQP